MYTEYGADTVAGFHSAYGEPFSEEYQEDYYRMNSKVLMKFLTLSVNNYGTLPISKQNSESCVFKEIKKVFLLDQGNQKWLYAI